MEYVERGYRKRLEAGGLRSFCVKYKETDLWIGVSPDQYSEALEEQARTATVNLRREMDAYILLDPDYRTSLVPYPAAPFAPLIFSDMSAVSRRTGIGPMSAVAGAVNVYVAKALRAWGLQGDLVIENGGDILAESSHDLDISVFAGASVLSERVGLHIPASAMPLGICTSSGTVGPSLSMGKADAVMIVCRDVMLADSYATAMANKVRTIEDVQPVADLIACHQDILGAIVIKADKMGIAGMFEMRIFS